MNGIERDLKAVLESKIGKGKVLLLIGPRQVGKTTLLKNILTSISSEKKVQFWNCDESDVRQLLSEANSAKLKSFVGNSDFIVIDEAQRVKDIGLTIKLLHDSFPNVQLAVTGSSSLDLSNSINEPLTGRKFEYNLFPFSTNELVNHTSMLEEMRLLKNRLVYGFYPDVVNNPGEEKEILTNIANSYLYKDLFEFQDIRKSSVIEKLVQALALQVGSEVSFNELGNLLGIDTVTVQRYVDLLEKAHRNNWFSVIFLSETQHQVHHSDPTDFISLKQCIGDGFKFLDAYIDGMTLDISFNMLLQLKQEEQYGESYSPNLIKAREQILDWSNSNTYK